MIQSSLWKTVRLILFSKGNFFAKDRLKDPNFDGKGTIFIHKFMLYCFCQKLVISQNSDKGAYFSMSNPEKKKTIKTSIGGQAVIEGVMMRGPKVTALSVRMPISPFPPKNGLHQMETNGIKDTVYPRHL